jgi:PAS domain S-box-containing protein
MTEKTSVLHVDDDPDCLESVARAIERTDEAIDVHSVTDPGAARSRLAADADRIDCVVSEYDLPDTDGLALFEGLREIDPTIPFVLFTGAGSEAIAARAISVGVTDYIRKGAGIDGCEALAERVGGIVSKRRAASDREPEPGPESEPEPERKRTDDRYERIVETTDDVVYTLDTDGRFEFVNEAFVELTGYGPEEVLGRSAALMMDEADFERFENAIRALRTGPENQTTVEFEGITADGEVIPCEDQVALREVDGEFRGTVGIVRDVTDRKERKGALRTLHEATREMMAADSRRAIGEIASETATEVLDLPMNGIHLQGEDGGLAPIAVSQATRETLGEVPTIEPDTGIAWQVFVSGDPRAVGDVRETPGVLDPGTPIRSELYVPLGDHGVFVLSSTTVEDFAEADVALAKILAANVETALDRVEHERILESLHTGTRAMMNAETTEEVCELAVETARDALGLPITGLWSYDPEAIALRPAAITDGGHTLFEEIPTFTPENSLSWEVFRTGEPAVYDDVGAQPGAYDPETPIASEIIVPVGDYGVLNSGSTETGTFDASDVSVALILAANVEAALERAEREALLRDRETQLARERDNLAALFENVPDPMVRYERADGTVIPRAVNPAFERVFGYEEGQVIDRPLTETIVPSEGVDEHRDLTAAASAGDPLNAEIERDTITGRRTFLLRDAPSTTSARSIPQGRSERRAMPSTPTSPSAARPNGIGAGSTRSSPTPRRPPNSECIDCSNSAVSASAWNVARLHASPRTPSGSSTHTITAGRSNPAWSVRSRGRTVAGRSRARTRRSPSHTPVRATGPRTRPTRPLASRPTSVRRSGLMAISTGRSVSAIAHPASGSSRPSRWPSLTSSRGVSRANSNAAATNANSNARTSV